jgi:hypothetical protein
MITSAEQCVTWESEVYMVHNRIWKAAGVEPMGGCLCIGCLERRIGRRLKPKDFPRHVFNQDARLAPAGVAPHRDA